MIRGALEVAGPAAASGWLYSKSVDLEGAMVLAFIGTRCVGTGKIGLPRPDLVAAGLGHGRYGFWFPVAIDKTEDAGALVVRLQDSDLALMHANSRVNRPAA
jgi:hypothetical protein